MDEKTIYIDITGILAEKKTHIPAELFVGIVSELTGANSNIQLLYFSDKIKKYIITDKKEYSELVSGKCKEIIYSENSNTIAVSELQPYSVFLDISFGNDANLQRDWLFSQLINLNIEIAAIIPHISPVVQPHLYTDTDRMRFMYYIMANLRYAEKIITTPKTAGEIENLRKKLKTKSKEIITVLPDKTASVTGNYELSDLKSVSLQVLQFLNKENQVTFSHKTIKQMVFLSARPRPLLNTLPYIFHYMKFIKEIVVCCPDSMAEYLRKYYNGDAKLTLITDTELLGEHKLPEDHATRNFFLRCLAMQRDELDDEFIMSDDDYRPLTEITEDVFFSNGRYNAYYFIDMENWRHTVTDIFSYDRSHFKTLKFLKENGYPTLQYSGHQPQVINKKWYQQLISQHSEIVTRGYDEWSTYFDFCAVHFRKYFRQLPYITLGWPNVGTVWKHGVKVQNYLFENFYEDNYIKDGIFSKLSPGFCGMTDSENKIKVQTAQKVFSDFASGFEVRDSFYRSYSCLNNQLPSFSIHCPSGEVDSVVCISAPESYQIKRGVLNEIRFRISRADLSVCNSNNIIISVTVSDKSGKEIFRVEKSVTPEQNETNCHIDLYVPDRELILNIRCVVERISVGADVSIPLILL